MSVEQEFSLYDHIWGDGEDFPTIAERNIVSRVRIKIGRYLAMETHPQNKQLLKQLVRLPKIAELHDTRQAILRATRFLLLDLLPYYVRPAEQYFLLECVTELHVNLGWFPDLTAALRTKLLEWVAVVPQEPLEPLTADYILPINRWRLLMLPK